jgi:DNA-binding GntR family transcriptional regulator
MRRGAPKLREQAYASFTEHLLARDIRPGQFVSQRELVEADRAAARRDS